MKIKILALALGLLFLCLSVQSKEKIKPNEEFLSRAVEFHGHLGPYLVLGLRAGLYANQVMGREPMKTEAFILTKTTPPESCFADGVQLSTGCTFGKGNISLTQGEGLLVTFKKDSQKLTLKLKKGIIEEMDSLPSVEKAWEDLAKDLYQRKIEEIFEISDNPFKKIRVNARRLEHRIQKLGEFGKNPQGGISRVAFSEADIQGRNYVMNLMKEVGLKVRVDEAGNIIGRRKGSHPELPAILFGSHLDSVPNGGKYDGALGVLGGIECVQVLQEQEIKTHHPLEVVVFTDEEGGLVGSRAMTGRLTPEALEVVSHSGKTIREGIRAIGGNPDKLTNVLKKKGDIKAFIEIHIEQGSILETKKIDIGVVEGIVGINWWKVTIEGFSNHAGTTPMNMRQDALLAAAHLIIAVNQVVTRVPGRQVGTVGRIQVEPGAPNVIPGRVVMSIELRDLSAKKIYSLYEQIEEEAKAIAAKTDTKITFAPIDVAAVPAPTEPRLRQVIADSARELGLTSIFMPSGAGHDAQEMAKIAPTGMIFVPSVGGISHSPQEYTRPEDMANGANVLLHTILKIDRGALD